MEGKKRRTNEGEEENIMMESNNRSDRVETREMEGGEPGENKRSEGNTSLCF